MATMKIKLRPSAVDGKAGTIYYQITHKRFPEQTVVFVKQNGLLP